MGRRGLVPIAPSPPPAARADGRHRNYCRSPKHRHHSRPRYRHQHLIEELGHYSSGHEDLPWSWEQHERRYRSTCKFHPTRPQFSDEFREPNVYYSTTLKALRNRERAQRDDNRRRKAVVYTGRGMSPDVFHKIWTPEHFDAIFDDMHQSFDRLSLTRWVEDRDVSWTDSDDEHSYSHTRGYDQGRQSRHVHRDETGHRHHHTTVHDVSSRPRNRLKNRHEYKTVEEPYGLPYSPVKATRHRICDGPAEAVMSGARDPRDAVTDRERRRAALLQDDHGVWHEFEDSDERHVVRALGSYDRYGECCEGGGRRIRQGEERWCDRAQPSGFVKEFDWS